MTGTGVIELGIQARAQLEAGRWVQAATLFRKMEKSTRLSPNENVYYGVALTNLNEVDKALNRFTDTALASSNRRNFVRRRAVVPQLQSKNYSNAEAVLQRLLEIAPDNVANLGSLATIFLREERDSDALGCLKKAYALNPDSAALRSRLLQTYVRLNDATGASEFALSEKHRWADDPRFAQLSAIALLNAHKPEDALGAADAILAQTENDAPAMAAAARIYLDAVEPQKALDICRAALHAKIETAEIRFIMAQACRLKGGDPSIAIHHLRACQTLDADHSQSAAMLGKLLMLSGDFKSAIVALETAVRVDPKQLASRIDLAHSLHLLRRYDDAADAYGAALKMASNVEHWTPMAVATLFAAGRRDEAEKVFAGCRKHKSRKLPKTLVSGLDALSGQIDGAGVAKEDLDWAWSIARNLPGGHPPSDRGAWERSALWGHRADALISDWMECRPEKHRELLDLIDIGEDTRNRLHGKLSHGKGAIIATAHIGPLLSAPFALRKLDTPYRWLAPIPPISPVASDGSLISTSALSDMDVSFEFFHALAKGNAVAVAVDGTLDPSAPTIPFQGRQIPYSDFAARAAYRHRVASFFAMPVWRNRRIDFLLKPLPCPHRDETLSSFKCRWTDAFCAHLKNAFALPPENLRMRGGIWRRTR